MALSTTSVNVLMMLELLAEKNLQLLQQHEQEQQQRQHQRKREKTTFEGECSSLKQRAVVVAGGPSDTKVVTQFHSSVAPPIRLLDYAEQLVKHTALPTVGSLGEEYIVAAAALMTRFEATFWSEQEEANKARQNKSAEEVHLQQRKTMKRHRDDEEEEELGISRKYAADNEEDAMDDDWDTLCIPPPAATSAPILPLNIHRLFITALVLTVKLHSDFCLTNADYATVGGVPVDELHRLEVALLSALDWRTQVGLVEYNAIIAAADELQRQRHITQKMTFSQGAKKDGEPCSMPPSSSTEPEPESAHQSRVLRKGEQISIPTSSSSSSLLESSSLSFFSPAPAGTPFFNNTHIELN